MTQLTIGKKVFNLAPSIGTCLSLQAKGIDLLGISGESELQKLVANPLDFLTALETLIGDQIDGDESYKMPALANYMTDGQWPLARVAVLESFQTFFHDNGYPQLAEGLKAFEGAAKQVTDSVTASLASGALGKAIEKAVSETVEELTTID